MKIANKVRVKSAAPLPEFEESINSLSDEQKKHVDNQFDKIKDMHQTAKFFKIVRNYMQMKRKLNEDD